MVVPFSEMGIKWEEFTFKKENQEFCSDNVNLRCLLNIPLEMSSQWQWIHMSESSVKWSECGGRNILLTNAGTEKRLTNVVLVIICNRLNGWFCIF